MTRWDPRAYRGQWVRREAAVLPFFWHGAWPVLALLVLALYALRPFAHAIQASVLRATEAALGAHGEGWSHVVASGQDVVLGGTEPLAGAGAAAIQAARTATCPSWAGRQTCAVAVSGRFAEAVARRPAPTGASAPAPASRCERSLADVAGGGKIGFTTGSASIGPASVAVIEALAQAAGHCQGMIRVEGYTDSVGAAAANRVPTPQLTDLGPALSAIAAIPAPQEVDLSPLEDRLAQLERAVKAIDVPAPGYVGLSAIERRLEDLQQSVRAMGSGGGEAYQPLAEPQLASGVEMPSGLEVPPPAPAPAVTAPEAPASVPEVPAAADLAAIAPPSPREGALGKPEVREGSRNLLAHAGYGAPDDLKQIKGVKRVMEGMLHGIGVYYFWQIAEWTPSDIEHADAQLPAFHGRIERDGWVEQAASYLGRAGIAQKPAE